MAFEIGSTVGGYEFIDVINSNPKSLITYKVRNVKFGRTEMLRILPLNLQGDQEKVERFLREIKVHARLSHPNIVTFFNATEIDGQLVMTMELVEGTPLALRLELGKLPWAEAVEYMRQVLSALNYAHKQGIVHRDVTPANILVTPDKRAMLSGFGMAKGGTDPNLTQTGTAIGVAQYMSPEQVKGVSALDPRSDLYSVGVVLYEAVTGRVPFNASSQFEIMLAHVKNAPVAPSSSTPGLPEGLDHLILKALAKEPAQRFQTAGEFSDALGALEQAPRESAVKTVPAAVGGPVAVGARSRPVDLPARGASPRPARIAASAPVQAPVVKPPTAPSLYPSPSPVVSAAARMRREWTWDELILGGVVAATLFTVIFLVILSLSGMLPLRAGN